MFNGGYMGGISKFHNLVSIFTSSFRVNDQDIEVLRSILEREQKRKVTFEEAEEVSKGLITVLETLANGRKIVVNREKES